MSWFKWREFQSQQIIDSGVSRNFQKTRSSRTLLVLINCQILLGIKWRLKEVLVSPHVHAQRRLRSKALSLLPQQIRVIDVKREDILMHIGFIDQSYVLKQLRGLSRFTFSRIRLAEVSVKSETTSDFRPIRLHTSEFEVNPSSVYHHRRIRRRRR